MLSEDISYLAHHWVWHQNVDPTIRKLVGIELVDQMVTMAFLVHGPTVCSRSEILRRRHLELKQELVRMKLSLVQRESDEGYGLQI